MAMAPQGDRGHLLSFVALVIPIVAVLLGATLGSETFDVVDLLGATIVVFGIYVSVSRRVAALGRAALGREAHAPRPSDPPERET